MQIYLTVNTLNKKWYIGQDSSNRSWYLGSGSAIKRAIKKYGRSVFKKFILENCENKQELNLLEINWIKYTNAVNDPMSYNIAKGGEGGPGNGFRGAINWFNSLSAEEKKAHHARQAAKRCKGWYVSRIDNSFEIYVENISKWCEDNKIDKSMPTALNTPTHQLYLKQTKGWRIRREDMPVLTPYIDKRKIGHKNIACKGKTWSMIDGKRVWSVKENT
jgi:hypothetical protein